MKTSPHSSRRARTNLTCKRHIIFYYGYFIDAQGYMSFANNTNPDAEWDAFVAGNASGEGVLVFGRITYELMANFWPTLNR